ncbi:hypothetical protein GA830_10520 [Mesorhizobium sp. NBSH29]|uniref:hypothetical protein n=1 Tax=Mesorhizobium sp. NBSH29 TaxID=2654249 RepID=UPI001896927A|nr:hypothetical protein [Mesorhizobium sp. NBSH29]QPC87128.1 hypothetical protein GA830_10520 [Mesorhizobium sp. NBSH29]
MGIISPAAAYAIASQWGSYMHATDPGFVFYTFPPNDARPIGADHRRQCLQHTADCLSIASQQATQAGINADNDEDVTELRLLRRFFTETDLRSAP